ncbi:type I-A CRISPR-associated protein Cas8a2/Csa4 [Pyrococcus furiosus DSM 3638]|uniref:Type I-A CRISPR-associated protein Cas8a2/Csa4 n=3 Tax=Pyrococcus furiosus TaxID=2261 RepID=Q8U337_PYRFU|nr:MULTISPECIES: type I-A CRISPR-associated protein Cas8a2/Csa4 [Pyrococcus]AAL80762.1 hypothetical protein PF0638 [Pyrococcus furiosus DSM 3638]AFN03427.1 hypothetical protein PFC_02325 [Pyrococcus furiosus COM1]MDK2869609.1 CRISPR-associated protein Csa4 [Pyrococcus sp.]QEK78339.1 type I-A CRISPR-associated protein Cas8a2/Csa4 [Pyrococcus furiosus DSM 3638]
MKLVVPMFSGYYSRVLNTHIMYGIVESALRAGVTNLHVVPTGEGYEIHSRYLDCRLKNQEDLEGEGCKLLLEGLRDALEEIIMTHYAMGFRSKKFNNVILSNTVISNGAFIDPPQNVQRYYRELEAILNNLDIKSLKSTKSLIDKKVLRAPQQLDPTLNQWLSFYKQEEGISRITNLEYALAWVGFYYYSSVHKFKRGSSQIVEIIQYPPNEEVEMWELLLIKDLATKIVQGNDFHWKISSEYGLLKTLLLTELPPSTEEVPGLSKFTVVIYGQESQQGKGWRIFRTLELPVVWDFIGYLKARAFYETMKFVKILNKLERTIKESQEDILREISHQLYSALTNRDEMGFYSAFRVLKRAGYPLDPELVNAIAQYLSEREVIR